MIGNDIIDLNLAKIESNWERKGFLEKIFTKKEQAIILKNKNPEIMVWNLWSRKEASYKIWNRTSQIRRFNPIQFECFDVEREIGIVKAFEQVFYTQTTINQNYIHSIALKNHKEFNSIQNIERSLITKKNGIPFLKHKTNKKVFVSISNHGSFEKIVMI